MVKASQDALDTGEALCYNYSRKGGKITKIIEHGSPDGEWAHVEVEPDVWVMVRTKGDLAVRKREKEVGDLGFELERLKQNGDLKI